MEVIAKEGDRKGGLGVVVVAVVMVALGDMVVVASTKHRTRYGEFRQASLDLCFRPRHVRCTGRVKSPLASGSVRTHAHKKRVAWPKLGACLR